jgi:hypothetical protein
MVAAAGCSAAPETEAWIPLPAAVASYLLAPSTSGEAGAAEIGALHRRLLAGEPTASLRRDLAALVTSAPASGAAAVLLAEIAFVDGQPAAARDLLAHAPTNGEAGAAARLLSARLHELSGASWPAYLDYAELAATVPIAAERRTALRSAAVADLAARVARQLADASPEAAADSLARLVEIDPESRATLDLRARVAAARGDPGAELDAVRALSARRPDDRALALRRGELEVEVGDAGRGLELLAALAAEPTDDGSGREALARAKFAYRLANAPEEIRRLSRSPQLGRADFARLLYWLVPAVRAARPGATRIATDLVDHPAREELVRVANLGLLRIDEVLHRFDPERALSRAEAFLALARLGGRKVETSADACVYALERRWIAEPAECLAAAPVAGAEATAWLRQTDGSPVASGSG